MHTTLSLFTVLGLFTLVATYKLSNKTTRLNNMFTHS
jgi:hypothetical protein